MIKQSKWITMVGGLILGTFGGMMASTNPGQTDYETYASDALTTYLKQDVCPQVAHELGGFLTSYCKTMVDTGKPQIRQIIGHRTVRANYLLFSIYETEISLPSPVPTYQFGTIGVLDTFFTYQAEEL
ncbi:MAG: DUF4359 domain-containing protein [Microcystaceae cyanobacterium]